MIVQRVSMLTGIYRELDLPITKEQWDNYARGAFVQDAFKNLNADQREFIISGITAEEWDAAFLPEDEE